MATASLQLPPGQPARIAVLGLGYVGSVSAACLAKLGHTVVGVDVAEAKVGLINRGAAPVREPGLDASLADAVAAGRLRATSNVREAVLATDVCFVCVGTPSLPSGGQNLDALQRVVEQVGAALRQRRDYYGVVVRSTVLPGTADDVVAPALAAASGSSTGTGFGVASHPEFLREGTAIADFFGPPYTVVGTGDERLRALLDNVYRGLDAPFVATSTRAAEMLKLACNAFHAVKVVFANEIGTLSKQLGVDGREVMELFVRDRKLNLSEKYLRPGFAFGGSCLPKDVRALTYAARRGDSAVPLLEALTRSNELHIQRAQQLVEQTGCKRIGILGLTFKPGTDDLRESPSVELTQTLLGRGYDVRVYDPSLDVTKLVGANRRFIEEHLPHLARLLQPSAAAVVAHSEAVVVGYDAPEFRQALGQADGRVRVIDLVGVRSETSTDRYSGIAW